MAWYFAWAEASETSFGAEHERFDEDVFSLSLSQQEGEFAALTVDLRNPRTGLLAAGRRRWAWLAWDGGDTAGTVPLFFGRLVGLPTELSGELVTLEFLARPADWTAAQAAVGETLKEAPWWDPVWLAAGREDDPAALLEARTAAWHVDPVTHAVTISDILQGEDGTLEFGAADILAGTLAVSPKGAPARRVAVSATVGWDQAAAGTVDLTETLLKAAKHADSGDGDTIDTYTGLGLAADWPRRGDAIGGGWAVGKSLVRRGDRKWKAAGKKTAVLSNALLVDFPRFSFRPVFKADYDASRSRTEKLSFTLEADVQDVVTDAATDELQPIVTASTRLEDEIDPADDTGGLDQPIGDPRRRSYFQTDRGHRSIEHLICLARAALLAQARCVDVSWEIEWRAGIALGLSLRKNARLADPRLPGGEALGKLTAWSIAFDGESGTGRCALTMSCAAGRGNAASPSPGTPVYVDDDYVADDYQVHAGAALSAAAGDVTWTPPDGQATPDDGVDLFALTPKSVVDSLEILGTRAEQEAVLSVVLPDVQAAVDALNKIYTQIVLSLVPLNTGPFETDYALSVGSLMVPRMIDLEAA